MKDVLLTPIRLNELETLIQNSVERAMTAKHLKQTSSSQQANEWFDLNELIEYDPEKRTKPTWYSKISKGEVPYHKKGKKVYFLKSEIDKWLRAGKCMTTSEIEAEADAFLANKKGGNHV